MNSEQLAQEIRELHDQGDRQEAAIDTIGTHLGQLAERGIPAAVADVRHTLAGTNELLSNLAGTVHSLAMQLHSMNDRLTLLEQVIDADLPFDELQPPNKA